MQWQEAAGLILSQAIARAQGGADNPARQLELADYYVKAAGKQTKARKLYTLAFACEEILRQRGSGQSYNQLRKRYPKPADVFYVKPVPSTRLMEAPGAAAPISPPPVIRGTVSETEGRAEQAGMSDSVLRALEGYV